MIISAANKTPAAYKPRLIDASGMTIGSSLSFDRYAITAVAAPVFARGGQVVASLEVSVTGSAPQYRMPAIQPALVVAARALTRQFAVNQISAINRSAFVAGDLSQLAMVNG